MLGLLEMKEVEMSNEENNNNMTKRRESVAAFNNQVWFMHIMLLMRTQTSKTLVWLNMFKYFSDGFVI